jgi:hypothetical protein
MIEDSHRVVEPSQIVHELSTPFESYKKSSKKYKKKKKKNVMRTAPSVKLLQVAGGLQFFPLTARSHRPTGHESSIFRDLYVRLD